MINSKSHHTGKTRTGNIQVLVGGLVLFMSGTLLGGYVVWSHLKERPAVAPVPVAPVAPQVVAPQVVGSEPVATIPQAHAFGTKSSFVVSPQTPAVAPDATKPQDSPPLAKPIGTKSLILVTPKDIAAPSFKGQPNIQPIGTPKGSGDFLAPPAMSFGTKSAPVFAPSDLQKNKGPYNVVSPFKVPAPSKFNPQQSPSGWRSPQVPTGNAPALQLPAPQSKPTRFTPKQAVPNPYQAAPNPKQAPPVSKYPASTGKW